MPVSVCAVCAGVTISSSVLCQISASGVKLPCIVSMSPASIASKKRCAIARMSSCSAMMLSLNPGAEHAAAVGRDQPFDVVALIGGIRRGAEGRQHVLRHQFGHLLPFGVGEDPIFPILDPPHAPRAELVGRPSSRTHPPTPL